MNLFLERMFKVGVGAMLLGLLGCVTDFFMLVIYMIMHDFPSNGHMAGGYLTFKISLLLIVVVGGFFALLSVSLIELLESILKP